MCSWRNLFCDFEAQNRFVFFSFFLTECENVIKKIGYTKRSICICEYMCEYMCFHKKMYFISIVIKKEKEEEEIE